MSAIHAWMSSIRLVDIEFPPIREAGVALSEGDSFISVIDASRRIVDDEVGGVATERRTVFSIRLGTDSPRSSRPARSAALHVPDAAALVSSERLTSDDVRASPPRRTVVRRNDDALLDDPDEPRVELDPDVERATSPASA